MFNLFFVASNWIYFHFRDDFILGPHMTTWHWSMQIDQKLWTISNATARKPKTRKWKHGMHVCMASAYIKYAGLGQRLRAP